MQLAARALYFMEGGETCKHLQMLECPICSQLTLCLKLHESSLHTAEVDSCQASSSLKFASVRTSMP